MDFAAKVEIAQCLNLFTGWPVHRRLQNLYNFGRSSDLLLLLAPSPLRKKSGILPKQLMELTAAGTVADSHGIPY
jgi:hypothetical protein